MGVPPTGPNITEQTPVPARLKDSTDTDVDPMSKRQDHEIRDAIMDALERRPMNSSQLSKKIGTGQRTVMTHLDALEDLHVVRHITTRVRGEEKEVYELV